MIGTSIIESLNKDPTPTVGCRACMSATVPVAVVERGEVEVQHVAAVTFREMTETKAPIRLPAPPDGCVRVWLKCSEFSPRVLDVYVTEEEFLAVVEWPRDYHDILEDEILSVSRPDIFEDAQGLLRVIVANKLAKGAPGVHRTFAVEQGPWGKPFEVYEEHSRPVEALERFGALKGTPDTNQWLQGVLSDEREALLRVNGLYGLTETWKGHRFLERIVEAVRLRLFEKPIKYDDYKEKVQEPLDEVEAAAFVNLGILCSRCPGMTWGDVGYEIMRGMKGV